MRYAPTKNTCVACWIVAGLAFCLAVAPRARAAPIGDRLVIAVNSIPYTQRQLELYITVKESLRPENDGVTPVVDGGNWRQALVVFTEDMMILQEAQRLGSFTAADQMLDKYNAVVRQQLAKSAALQKTMVRLGVDDPTMSRTLDAVLRVAGFRRNKDRQEGQLALPRAGKKPSGPPKWLADLSGRTNSRVFEGADVFVVIEPTLGRHGESP